MNINQHLIVNFLPISAGGGLQNAMSFVRYLASDNVRKATARVIVKNGSLLQKECELNEIDFIPVKPTLHSRLFFELRSRSILDKYQHCFTLFGLPLLGSTKNCLNIIGSAYSNLFYPEIPFWSYLSPGQRLSKKIIDKYRRRLTATADYWIFETDILRKRAIDLCGFPENRVGVVRMSPSTLVSPENVNSNYKQVLVQRLPSGFKLLYLSGPHPNKRIHLLPGIAQRMKSSGVRDFSFILTLNENHPYTMHVVQEIKKFGVDIYFTNLGPIAPQDVATVINACDAMCNFSVLESFSNNFVEAWRMKRPLVATNAEWATASCGDAALYVDPTNVDQTATALKHLATDKTLQKSLTVEGARQLLMYPTPQEKYELYFQEIAKAVELGQCSKEERAKIHWK